MTMELLLQQVNTLWVLVAAALVFFMQAGFAMVEAGATRSKNSMNILMKNFMDFAFASLAFLAIGYAFMFGSGNGLIGLEGFFLKGLGTEANGLPLMAFWFFQVVFVGAAATIVSGAMAERTSFKAYIAYSIIISAIIYPIVGHWIWGGGWLAEMGFLDFGGSTVVHAVGGAAALAGIMIVGPRIGRFEDGKPKEIKASNLPLVGLGVFILWLGWFGFNGGSTLGMTDATLTSSVIVNTNLAACAGATIVMILTWAKNGKPDAVMTMNGVLAGLVGITAGCAFVDALGAIVIGVISAAVMMLGVSMLERFQLDDPVGAVPVHGFAGIVGTVALGLFHTEAGLLYGGGLSLLGIQTLGSLVAVGAVFVSMFAIFKIIDVILGVRVSRESEIMGLDASSHDVESYPEFVGLMLAEERESASLKEEKAEKMREVPLSA